MCKGFLWYANFVGVSLFSKNNFLHISTVGLEKALHFLMHLVGDNTKKASKECKKKAVWCLHAFVCV